MNQDPKRPRKRPSRARRKTAPLHGGSQLFSFVVTITVGLITRRFARRNPVISRTIEIRGDQTLSDLHDAIFAAFDRFDEHLYEFQMGSERSGDPKTKRYILRVSMEDSFDDRPATGDVATTTIASLGLQAGDDFRYWFDFGDDWWHSIRVLAIGDDIPRAALPRITKRIGESPPQYIEPDEVE